MGEPTERRDPTLDAVNAVLERQPARSRRAAELRGRAIDCARRTIYARGYFGCNLRDIASEIDTTASTIVRLFGTKYGLLSAVFDASYRTALGWLEDEEAKRHANSALTLQAGVRRVLVESRRDPLTGDFLIANSGNTDFLLGSHQASVEAPIDPTGPEFAFFSWFDRVAGKCIDEGFAPGMSSAALAEASVGIMERFQLNAYLYRKTHGRRYPYTFTPHAIEEIYRVLLDPTPPSRRKRRSWPDSFPRVSRLEGWGDSSSDRLLASAWIAFATKGYGGTTTRAISRGAKTSESELFRQFPEGKFDLLKSIYDRCYDLVLADLESLDLPAGEALREGALLLWDLYDSERTLSKFLIFNSGNADSLLIMQRKDDDGEAEDETALTRRTDDYFEWFARRACDALPEEHRGTYGDALGQAILGIVERIPLAWYRDEHVYQREHNLSAQHAIVPLERLLDGLQTLSLSSGEKPKGGAQPAKR